MPLTLCDAKSEASWMELNLPRWTIHGLAVEDDWTKHKIV